MLPEKVNRWNRNYVMIETSCRSTYHCVPCKYPYCQRNMKLKRTAVRSFGRS